ncbi:MAG: hypothetical protein LQ348_005238 [Seirophora lacunosa]|nr:MAG: hypothetical protein LQ348_005238 [Seirophora lacunosa]
MGPNGQLAVLILLLSLLSNVCQSATVPIRSCRPKPGRTLYRSYRECATRLPEYSLENISSLSVPSANLIPMPHEPFRYEMTLSALGVIFSNYQYTLPIPNDLVRALLRHAGEELERKLALNPQLETTSMRAKVTYVQEEHDLTFAIEPRIPHMTYGDQYAMISVLASWAARYESVECNLDIWAWPGMRQQRNLGKAYFII